MGSTLCTEYTHSADVDASISTLHRNHVQGRDDVHIEGEGGRSPTGFSSEIGTKLRDWAVGQAWGSIVLK